MTRLQREGDSSYLVVSREGVALGRVAKRGSKWNAYVQPYEFGQPTARMLPAGQHPTRRAAVDEVEILREDA